VDKSFLIDEERIGFYIPSSVKCAWAAQLEVLAVVDKICSDYGIKYFADWGTLLGAVRHGGFIPWDDDLDIVMIRQDYDKFVEVSKEALPKGFLIHTFRTEGDYDQFHAVVQNGEHPKFTPEHMRKFHNFPYLCGLDIFILDYMYQDEKKEKERIERIKYIIAIADGMRDGMFDAITLQRGFNKIEKDNGVIIDRTLDTRKQWIFLYELAEKVCAEVKPKDATTLTQMIPWGLKSVENLRFDKSFYDETIRLPFEYTTIPVPLKYDEMLKRRYGMYHHMVKDWETHDYPFFKKQKEDLQKLLDFEMPHYSWNEEEKNKALRGNENKDEETFTWKEAVSEYVENLKQLQNMLDSGFGTMTEGCTEQILDVIATMQDVAIEVGNLIEQVKGEGYETIHCIEGLCEALFKLYNDINEFNHQKDCFANVINRIEEEILNRRTVVFLPCGDIFWDQMADAYAKECEREDTDVYVVPIPYYYKDYDGSLIEEVFEPNRYHIDGNSTLGDYKTFSLELEQPDVIYISNPYDEFNDAISVSPQFFSGRLKECTSKLVYIPWIDLPDFDKKEIRAYQNMDYYVTMPGVVRADEVILRSEKLRELYIDKLIDWAGEDTRNIWEEKIVVSTADDKPSFLPKKKSTLMYYVGNGPAIENIDKLILRMDAVLSLIKKNKDRIKVVLVFESTLEKILEEKYPEIIKQFKDLVVVYIFDEFGDINIRGQYEAGNIWKSMNLDMAIAKSCDAYYGDPGPYVPIFLNDKKPIMIANWDVEI